MDSDKFKAIDENGNQIEAEIITVFSTSEDIDNASIFVSRLVRDKDGNDMLENIEDIAEREEIHKVVEELLSKE